MGLSEAVLIHESQMEYPSREAKKVALFSPYEIPKDPKFSAQNQPGGYKDSMRETASGHTHFVLPGKT